jgi:hypothetical protein
MLDPPTSASIPDPVNPAKVAGSPLKDMVGSPEMPLPLEMDSPLPETAIERPVMAVEDVFT